MIQLGQQRTSINIIPVHIALIPPEFFNSNVRFYSYLLPTCTYEMVAAYL